jgi:hypothetical protein
MVRLGTVPVMLLLARLIVCSFTRALHWLLSVPLNACPATLLQAAQVFQPVCSAARNVNALAANARGPTPYTLVTEPLVQVMPAHPEQWQALFHEVNLVDRSKAALMANSAVRSADSC